MMTSLILVLPD